MPCKHFPCGRASAPSTALLQVPVRAVHLLTQAVGNNLQLRSQLGEAWVMAVWRQLFNLSSTQSDIRIALSQAALSIAMPMLVL
jgi:hypothetical protein